MDDMDENRCVVCGAECEPEPWFACEECKSKYPPSLIKAVSDEFDYALKLKTGEIIRFCSAEIHGDYATIYGEPTEYGEYPLNCWPDNNLPYSFPRGLDIRISDIVWCADAPEGS